MLVDRPLDREKVRSFHEIPDGNRRRHSAENEIEEEGTGWRFSR